MEKQYDFAGWATRHNVKCSDGRTITPNAFQHCDGQVVPLVWNHDHKDPFNVLGHAELEYRPEGVYTYCAFNDTEQGRNAKQLVQHGDVISLSIYANRLKQKGGDVLHGEIREVSLVLAGANPEAHIESVMAHGEEIEDEATIYAAEGIEIFHAEEQTKEKENMAEETKTPEEGKKEKTIADVYNEFTEEQKTVVHTMIGMALEDAKGDSDEEDKVEQIENLLDVLSDERSMFFNREEDFLSIFLYPELQSGVPYVHRDWDHDEAYYYDLDYSIGVCDPLYDVIVEEPDFVYPGYIEDYDDCNEQENECDRWIEILSEIDKHIVK